MWAKRYARQYVPVPDTQVGGLQYRGRAGAVLAISAATLLADSALNLMLIPRYGMEGAAGGTALTLTAAAAAVIAVHRRAS